MAYTGIFATVNEITRKAGANANATITVSEDAYNDWIAQSESFVNVFTKNNFSDTYATLNADVKGILRDVASNLTAIYVIQYDMSGFTSRAEAEDMVNILRDSALRGLAVLKDRVRVDFINGA